MAAEDKIHDAVRTALIKDGWTITAEHFNVKYEDADLQADLAAERVLAAERGLERIVVEIKSFLGPSLFRDLQQALGQYEIYRMFLEMREPERKIFLAISDLAYSKFFERKSVQLVRQRSDLKLIVVDLDTEEITKWID